MTRTMAIAILAATACGGHQHPTDAPMDRQLTSMMSSMEMPMDDGASYGPLTVGADYATYVKMNTAPVTSETHGGRLVDTYVNAVGAAAYLDPDAAIPVGTVIVKTSEEPARWAAKLGGPIYWRSPSHKVGYCVECHDNYDRNLGDVPGPLKIQALP